MDLSVQAAQGGRHRPGLALGQAAPSKAALGLELWPKGSDSGTRDSGKTLGTGLASRAARAAGSSQAAASL